MLWKVVHVWGGIFEIADVGKGGIKMLMDANEGEGGVKN